MYNPSHVTSTISIRYRAPISYPLNDYSYDYRFNGHLISSLQSCCCICCSTSYVYRNPLNPRFVCGSRQSSLIHGSASRRFLIQPEPDPYCSWSPVQDTRRKCCCKCVKERDLGERKFKRMASGGRSFDFETTEMMLSLLIEDVSEECYGVKERDCSSSRRLDVERKSREGEKKKNVKSGLLSSDSRSKYEDLRMKSRENEASNMRKEDKGREDEEVSKMRNLGRRKSGSSSSSFHTCLSLGEESDSDSDIRVRNEAYGEESSKGYKRDSRESENVVYKGENKENLRKLEGIVGSHKMIESDWRKKAEKKLGEVAIEDGCETSQHQGLSSHKKIEIFDDKSKKFIHDRGTTQKYSQASEQRDDYRYSPDKSNQVSKIEDINSQRTNISESEYETRVKRQENRFYGVSSSGQDSRETDSRRKFQQSAEISDDRVGSRGDYSLRNEKSNQVSQIKDINVNRTNISQSRYEDKVKRQEDSYYLKSENDSRRKFQKSAQISDHVNRKDTKVRTNNSQAQYEDKVKNEEDFRRQFKQSTEISDDRVSRRDDYRLNTQQSDQVSKIQEKNVSGTKISRAQYDEKVKRREDRSSLISSSAQDTEYQYYLKSEDDSRQRDSRRKLQGSTETSDDRVSQRDDYKSSTEQSNQVIQIQDINATPNISLEHYQEKVKRQEDTENRYYLQSEEDLRQMDSRRKLQQSTEIAATREQDIQSDQEANSKTETPKGSLEMSTSTPITPEDALGTAHQFQKSSSKLVVEFLEKAVHEASTSQSQIEKSTYEKDKILEEPSESGSFKVKGPSEEIWDEVVPSIPESIDTKIQIPEKTSPGENVVVKRTGRSMWNVFSDIVRLRWSSHPKITTPSLRNSPNQSTSEAWFSGQDRYETSEENIKIVNKKTSRESMPTPTESQGEGYTSSSSKDKISPSKTPIVSSTVIEEKVGSDMKRKMLQRTNQVIKDKFDDVAESDKGAGSDTEGEVGSDMKRRMFQRTNQVIKDRFDEWEEAFMVESEQRKVDEGFMREALLEAKIAGDMWEVPVGAVLVQHGKIIARGYNLVEEMRDSTAHAEMICIREASNQLQSWRLAGTTLYVTLEPCPMCAGAILQARVDTVVWGAPNKLLGADGSWIRLFPDGGDGGTSSDPTDKPPAPVHPFHPKITIRRGVLGAECADVMQQFFQRRRRTNNKKKLPDTPPTPPSCLPISNHPSKILNRVQGAFHFMFCL